jgi:Ca2+/H+ antiporter, TMEM165/GDT1 family
MDQGMLLTAFATTAGTIFVAELTDKDALFLLALATKTKPSLVFAAGSVAFVISTAIIVLVGSVLLALVPVLAIKLAGGTIMLGYAVWEFYRFSSNERRVDEREERLLEKSAKGAWSVFLPAVVTLVALDLAGDATELVTVVLLARFQDALAVFSGAVTGLICAVAVETALGNRLGRVLSRKRITYLSVAVFTAIGTTVIVTSLLGA